MAGPSEGAEVGLGGSVTETRLQELLNRELGIESYVVDSGESSDHGLPLPPFLLPSRGPGESVRRGQAVIIGEGSWKGSCMWVCSWG